jgi:hypothetical protein
VALCSTPSEEESFICYSRRETFFVTQKSEILSLGHANATVTHLMQEGVTENDVNDIKQMMNGGFCPLNIQVEAIKPPSLISFFSSDETFLPFLSSFHLINQ